MTNRLPPALKKRLQANLGNLTGREAGRLLLLYTQEADKKGKDWATYPPIKELWAALESRVEKSRGKPEEAEAVKAFNGVVFLSHVITAINHGDFVALTIAFAFDSHVVAASLASLLREDATTVLIQAVKRNVFDDMPKPLPRDDYRRLMQWASTDALYPFGEAATFAAESAVEDKALPEGEEDAEANRIYEALVAGLKTGKVKGGEAVYHPELSEPVLIEAGKLPAWAALRLTWKPDLFARRYRVYDRATFADWSPATIDQVVAPTGEILDLKDLRRLAADFYKDCRRRPWGKGLVAKPDLDALVKMLTQSASSMLHVNPADFGRVDWATFRKVEPNWDGYRRLEESEIVFETEPAGTVASLAAAVKEMGRRADFGYIWLEDQFHPSSAPEYRRRELAQMVAMMATLDTTRQPFTYGYAHKEEGEISLADLLGVNFLTPLEETVGKLQRQLDFAASLRKSLQIVSDRYFGGLPLLQRTNEEALVNGEGYLKMAVEALASWRKRLSVWPWEIDTSSLEIDAPAADAYFDLVEENVALILSEAKARSRVDNPDELFGKE